MKRRLLLLFCALCAAVSHLFAQRYIIDDNLADSVSVYAFTRSANDDKEHVDRKSAVRLPVGSTVDVQRLLAGDENYGVISMDGREYAVRSYYLVLDPTQGDAADIFDADRDMRHHSASGKWFGSPTPYWLIFGCFTLALLLAVFGGRREGIRSLALVAVPVLMLAGAGLEIWGFLTMGKHIFWWCSPEKLGFWKSCLMVLPFVFTVFFQIFSFRYYQNLLFGNDRDERRKVAVKWLVVGLAGALVAGFVAMLVCGIAHRPNSVTARWGMLTFLVIFGFGFLSTLVGNCKRFGVAAGLSATVFSTVYLIGLLPAVVGLAVVLVQMILQVIIQIIVCGFIYAFIASGGAVDTTPVRELSKKQGRTYTGAFGRQYETLEDANRSLQKAKKDGNSL